MVSWKHCLTLSIPAEKVAEDLTDFPVYINLSSSSGINDADLTAIFDELGAESLKLAVMQSDGKTECYVEVVSWDEIAEVAEIWVKAPALSATEDTILYLYFDSDHADNVGYVGVTGSTPAQNVWDSNFKLVCHMNDNPDTSHVMDSTSNDNDGTKQGANEPIKDNGGKIGECQLFDGLNDKINVGDITVNVVATFELWFKPTLEQQQVLLKKVDEFIIRDTIDDYIFFGNSGGFGSDLSPSFTGLNTWNYVTAIWDGTKLEAYINGETLGTPVNLGAVVDTVNPVELGVSYFAGYFKGYMDEVRVSNVARSSVWVGASYESQRDQFINYLCFQHHIPVMGDWTPKGGKK